MKYLIALIICIVVIINVNAQSFVKENKIWSVACFDDYYKYIKTEYTKFENDTMINGSELYKKIFVSNDQISWWETGRFIIEDVGNVFFNISDGSYKEQLYDFNIEKGDSVYSFFDFSSFQLNVTSVIVKVILGVDRKHFYLSNDILWIEGIGSLDGPLEPFGKLKNGFRELMCVHEDGVLIYQNPNYSECKVTSSVVLNSTNKKLIEIFSSSAGLLRLSLLNDIKGELTLYSSEGKLLFKSHLNDRETEICSPSDGILLFRFINEKGEVQSGKIIAL